MEWSIDMRPCMIACRQIKRVAPIALRQIVQPVEPRTGERTVERRGLREIMGEFDNHTTDSRVVRYLCAGMTQASVPLASCIREGKLHLYFQGQ